jgi:hypothetical protein
LRGFIEAVFVNADWTQEPHFRGFTAAPLAPLMCTFTPREARSAISAVASNGSDGKTDIVNVAF